MVSICSNSVLDYLVFNFVIVFSAWRTNLFPSVVHGPEDCGVSVQGRRDVLEVDACHVSPVPTGTRHHGLATHPQRLAIVILWKRETRFT